MCSVVGYVGKNYSRSFVIEGLTRLEYRGYDSAGFVCLHPVDNRLIYTKTLGGVANLVNNFEHSPIDGFLGMGHTRWSTHGITSIENSHPQFDCNKRIAVVHNGILENYAELKKELIKAGHNFYSQTDTEVIAHMLELLLPSYKNLEDAISNLVNKLEGAYAFACISEHYPDTMIIARKRSPLCIGYGDDEMFIASDLLAFAGRTNKVLFLREGSFALVKKDRIELFDFNGNSLPLDFQIVDVQWSIDEKQGYKHFMLKEIYEQKKVIQSTVYNYKKTFNTVWNQMGLNSQNIFQLESMHLLGCGTSWHAAQISRFFFEKIAALPVRVHLASEVRHCPFFSEKNSFILAISQSGETADTLEAVRFLNAQNMHTIALTNVVSSTLVRETKGYLQTYAGPEIAVASTKSFTAQLAVLYLLAHKIAVQKGIIDKFKLELAYEQLLMVAEILESAIENYKQDIIEKWAPFYSRFEKIFFIGRYISYPFSLEAALKLKEIAYIFTASCPAGELKHGSLALVDSNIPVFLFSTMDPIVYKKLVSNAQEIKARSGHLVVFAFENQQELINLADLSFILPQVKPLLDPLAMTGLMQFFVYQIAKVLARPIDKPRNLAKSVTVE